MGTERTYNHAEAAARLQEELPAWNCEAGGIRRVYKTADWNTAVELVNRISPLAEAADHHPDIELGYGKVKVSLMTHSAREITDKDFDLASQIEQSFLSGIKR